MRAQWTARHRKTRRARATRSLPIPSNPDSLRKPLCWARWIYVIGPFCCGAACVQLRRLLTGRKNDEDLESRIGGDGGGGGAFHGRRGDGRVAEPQRGGTESIRAAEDGAPFRGLQMEEHDFAKRQRRGAGGHQVHGWKNSGNQEHLAEDGAQSNSRF